MKHNIKNIAKNGKFNRENTLFDRLNHAEDVKARAFALSQRELRYEGLSVNYI